MSYYQEAKAACGPHGTPDDLRAAVESAQEAFNPFNIVDWLRFALLAFQSRNDAVLQYILDSVQGPLDTLNYIQERCQGAEEERVDGWIERTTTVLKNKIHEFARDVYNYNYNYNSNIGYTLRRILYGNKELQVFAAHKACETRNPPMLKDVLSIIGESETIDTKDKLYRRLNITLDCFVRCGNKHNIPELEAVLKNFKRSYKTKSERRFHPY